MIQPDRPPFCSENIIGVFWVRRLYSRLVWGRVLTRRRGTGSPADHYTLASASCARSAVRSPTPSQGPFLLRFGAARLVLLHRAASPQISPSDTPHSAPRHLHLQSHQAPFARARSPDQKGKDARAGGAVHFPQLPEHFIFPIPPVYAHERARGGLSVGAYAVCRGLDDGVCKEFGSELG